MPFGIGGKKKVRQVVDAAAQEYEADLAKGLQIGARGNHRAILVFPKHIVLRQYKEMKTFSVDWEKSIAIEAIQAIQFRAPTKTHVGYLQVSVTGAQDATRHQAFGTLMDENTVHFWGPSEFAFLAVKDHLERMIFA